jgi:hypothetical protein
MTDKTGHGLASTGHTKIGPAMYEKCFINGKAMWESSGTAV